MMTDDQRLGSVGKSTLLLLAALVAGLLLAFLSLTAASARDAKAAIDKRAVSKARTDGGFPVWYRSARGQRLELCLDGPPLCLARAGDLTAPDGEAFYFDADAQIGKIGVGGAGRARLVLAVEAAFANANPDSQIAFGRVRVFADNLRPNTTYKITEPYGVLHVKTDDRGRLRYSKDVGAGVPHRFGRALRSRVFDGFLRWTNPPPGHLGNPNVPHKVVGSPTGNNFFLIEGPNVGGRGDANKKTLRFSVQGKRF